jgi:2-polyprenyl-3-methyl-5-hydroxy-6-metoxy-1,4-benzoquinol methylase
VTITADTPPAAPVRAADPAVCPLCAARAVPAFTAHDRNREITAQPFRYRRCTACAAISLVDVPEDLGPFYPSEYYGLRDPSELDGLIGAEQHKIDRVRAWSQPGRLVEIGPGVGVFAHGMRRAGYDVTAIEMDARACAYLRDVVGADAINSDDPAAALAQLPPSRAIAMWHVIEHLPDPWAVLDAAAANLEPGGALVVGTPNPDSLQLRLLKARWAHVDAPRHLFLLPLATLTERCSAHGLRRVEVTTTDPAGRHWNSFGWEYAARRRPAAGPAPRALALGAVGFSLAMRPLEHTGLRGAAYTAVFVKGDA